MFLRKSYYCIDTVQCERAFRDHEYTESEFVDQEGCCLGTVLTPCNAPLVLGKSRVRYELFVISLFLVCVALYVVAVNYKQVFPSSYQGVAFVTPYSEVNESESTIQIPVSRQLLEDEIMVEYRILSKSAKVNEDFIAENGSLVFAKNQDVAHITILILDDVDFKERREVFSIQLMNVVGQPIHQIIILDKPLSEEQIGKAEALVKQQSLLAADLAGYVKKELILRKAIVNLPIESPTREVFLEQLSVNQANIANARDAYISGFNSLKTIDQVAVDSILENLLASLERQAMRQQHQATLIMKSQYQRYLESSLLEMDIWLNELVMAVPGEADVPQEKFFLRL